MPRAGILRADEGLVDVNVVDRERAFSYEILIYDTSGNKVAEFASHTKNIIVSNLEFGYLRNGGCADFSFTLSEEYAKATIDYNYRVEICFYSQPNPWFTGFITKLPEKGTEPIQQYSGYGYVKQLDWIRVNETDTAEEVADINEDTVDDYIVPNTDIQKDSDKLDSPIYQMVSTVYWDRIPALDMFQRLQQLAGDYEFGVDEERDFYFRAIETDIKEKFWIGKHLTAFKSQEDQEPIRNRLYVKCGRLTDGSDYVFYVEDAGAGSSQATYGLREEVIVAPEFWPTYSATNLASGIVPTTNPVAGVPANATDGNAATIWDSGAAQAVGHYIQVDLGATFDHISRVVLDSSDDGAKEQYARGFDIRISTTGAFAGEETVVFTSTELSTDNPDIRFTPVQGRYVRVTLTAAHTEDWHVGEFEIYELDTSDTERWANYLLAEKKDIRKKATLTIAGVDKLISRKATIKPFKPTGKWGIYNEDGNHIDDYYVLAIKYTLSPGSFDMSAELGELARESIPATFKRTLQRLQEYQMSGVRSSDDLASGIGSSPLGITRTMISKDTIEVPHLKGQKISLYGSLVEMGEGVMSAGGHGFIVHDGTYYRVEIGKLNADYGITLRDSAGDITCELGRLLGVWEVVYEDTLTAATTFVDISGLDGNTDKIYRFIMRLRAGVAGVTRYYIRPNNDSGANYGRQLGEFEDVNVTAQRFANETGYYVSYSEAAGRLSIVNFFLFPRTGYIRTGILLAGCDMYGETVEEVFISSHSWNNTAANITSLRLVASQANGLGIGSSILLLRRAET